jgi:hypothetical protein
VSYFIDYDSINNFRVWNSKKWIVSDYRDVIFDENSYFDMYNKTGLIIELEKKKYVRYEKEIIINQVNQIEDLDSDEEKWQEMSIRQRVNKMKISFNNRRNIEIENDFESSQLFTSDQSSSQSCNASRKSLSMRNNNIFNE